MAKRFQSTIKISGPDNLVPGMVISSYIGLDERFKRLDKTDCMRLGSNFKGAKATVFRNNVSLKIKIQNLKIGDSIHKIFEIPPSNLKYTLVNDELIEYLIQNRFTKFSVKSPRDGKKQKSSFLEKLKKSEKLRKAKKTTTAKIYKASDVVYQYDNELLNQLKLSEKTRQNATNYTKPTLIKWEKPVIKTKDTLLVNLSRSEELRQTNGTTAADDSISTTNHLKAYFQNIKKHHQTRPDDYLDSLRTSIENRKDLGKSFQKAESKQKNQSSKNRQSKPTNNLFGTNNNLLENLKNSEELRKSLGPTKTKIYKASDVVYQYDNDLLKQMKRSEETRHDVSKIEKPIQIKWEKPTAISKDELLIGLQKSETLRQSQNTISEENKRAATQSHKFKQLYQKLKTIQNDQSDDYKKSMQQSIEHRNKSSQVIKITPLEQPDKKRTAQSKTDPVRDYFNSQELSKQSVSTFEHDEKSSPVKSENTIIQEHLKYPQDTSETNLSESNRIHEHLKNPQDSSAVDFLDQMRESEAVLNDNSLNVNEVEKKASHKNGSSKQNTEQLQRDRKDSLWSKPRYNNVNSDIRNNNEKGLGPSTRIDQPNHPLRNSDFNPGFKDNIQVSSKKYIADNAITPSISEVNESQMRQTESSTNVDDRGFKPINATISDDLLSSIRDRETGNLNIEKTPNVGFETNSIKDESHKNLKDKTKNQPSIATAINSIKDLSVNQTPTSNLLTGNDNSGQSKNLYPKSDAEEITHQHIERSKRNRSNSYLRRLKKSKAVSDKKNKKLNTPIIKSFHETNSDGRLNPGTADERENTAAKPHGLAKKSLQSESKKVHQKEVPVHYLDQLRKSMVFPEDTDPPDKITYQTTYSEIEACNAKAEKSKSGFDFLVDMKQSIRTRNLISGIEKNVEKKTRKKLKSRLSFHKYKASQPDQRDGYLTIMRRSIEVRDDGRRTPEKDEKNQNLLKTNMLYKNLRDPSIDHTNGFLESMKESIEGRVDGGELKPNHTKNQSKVVIKKPHQSKRETQVDKANAFIDDMKKSISIRNEAAGAMEDFMNKARKNKVDWQSINYYVDFVVKNSSSKAMAALANIKASDQTYGHCIDVASIFSSVYLKLKNNLKKPSPFKNEKRVMLAAFLHDFGKSQIPIEIIDSSKSFARDSKEMKLMQSHPELGAKLLHDKMNVPDHFINMAFYHHVKQSKNHINSYPKVDDSTNIIYETKLLAIIDVYQALIGKRGYKKPWAPAAAMHHLNSITGPEFDREVFADFRRMLGDYPVGTLVKLNNNSIGFVITVPKTDLSKPNIVLIKDAKGKEVNKHTLIDLKVEKGLSITQDLNTETVLGAAGADMFKQIQVS